MVNAKTKNKKSNKKRHTLTSEEKNTIVELVLKGATKTEMATKVNINERTLYNFLKMDIAKQMIE